MSSPRPRSEKTNQVLLEEQLWGSLGEVGVNVFKMGLTPLRTSSPANLPQNPGSLIQLELLNFRVIGELGLQQILQFEPLMGLQKPNDLNLQTLRENDDTISRGEYAVGGSGRLYFSQWVKEEGNVWLGV